MSYKFMFKEPFYSIGDDSVETWFVKSYEAADTDEGDDIDEADAKFQRAYNVKLIIEPRYIKSPYQQIDDRYDFVTGVEFPSEAEATMFVLRWS